MRDLMGIAAEAWVMTAMLAPSVGDERSLDIVRVQGALGIDQADPFAALRVCERPIPGSTRHDLRMDLQDAGPNRAATRETLRDDLIKVHRLTGQPAPLNAAVDLLTASRERVELPSNDPAAGPSLELTITPDVPVRVLLVDVLVHESLASMLRVEVRGNERRSFDEPGSSPAAHRDHREGVPLAVESMRPGALPSARAEWPQQRGLLDRLGAELGQGSDRFATHRLRLIHPIPGSRFGVTIAPFRLDA